jgi:hypothetical protein
MNKKLILDSYNKFQHADYDEDLVGMCCVIIEWLNQISIEMKRCGIEIDEFEPLGISKMQPHFPSTEHRKNLRFALSSFMRSTEEDEKTYLQNALNTVLIASYIYHFPTEKIYKIAVDDNKTLTRDEVKQILLSDDMSPNWIKEPSDVDYSALFL